MIDFGVARKKMVENQLRTSSVTDRRLLAVMSQLPRELFVPESRKDLAYIDEVHRLSAEATPRYLSAPAPFARLLQLADVGSADRVLDVGCGTGYSAAVLASLAAEVVAVESEPALAMAARANLASLSLDNASVVDGPLEAGWQGGAPYDLIVVEGAVEEIPPALFAQMKEGARLVALLTSGALAVAYIYRKTEGDIAGHAEFDARLPQLATAHRPPEFVF